jgi:pectin methylesterase-like acyl-CoA thioesterase
MLRNFRFWLGACVLAGALNASESPFKIVGPAAGSDYRTVQEAIDAVPASNASRRIILLQPGAYFGHTVLNKPHLTLRGAGPGTLLTYNLGQAVPGADDQPVTWRGAAALHLTPAAHDANIENLTLENTYGKGMQGQALVIEADRVAVRRCRITFPYGNPPTYLGRPWHESPSATFVACELGAGVQPAGWHEWHVKPPLVRFAEYQCTGPGAATDQRVAWATHSPDAAPAEFSRNAVLGDWNPAP